MKKSNNNKTYYIILFIISIILSYFFIYTHDDWAWGSSEGIKRLNVLFDNYNGRYLGNLIVMALTRSNILKTLVVGSVISLIIISTQRIINKKNTNILLVSILLFICMPRSIFQESIAWISGFSNYAVSTLLILIYYLNIEKYQKNKKILINILFLLLGFSVSLLMEHITIYNFLLSIFMLIYYKFKDKKINKLNIFYLIGSISGTILMFTNSAYYNISKGEDFYREVNSDNLIKKVFSNLNNILKHTFTNNGLMITLISLLLLKIIYDNKDKIKTNYLFQAITSYLFIYPVYCILRNINPNFELLASYTKIFDNLLSFLYVLIVFFITFKLITDSNLKKRLLFYLISIVILICPLLLVTPIGPRCFLILYLLMTLYVLELYNYLIKDKTKELLNKYLLLTIILVLAYLFEIYIHIYIANEKRHEEISRNLKEGDKSLCIEPLPHGDYVWFPNPIIIEFENYFKSYYNINEDVELDVKLYD